MEMLIKYSIHIAKNATEIQQHNIVLPVFKEYSLAKQLKGRYTIQYIFYTLIIVYRFWSEIANLT